MEIFQCFKDKEVQVLLELYHFNLKENYAPKFVEAHLELKHEANLHARGIANCKD